MVEVLAHHRDRWGHINTFADFLPLLTFDQFDAENWARLAVDAGMGYTVFVAKHHDGWCWWDAPNTRRTMVRGGPYRNVMADYAAACERNDIVFGTHYSLLDWGDPRSSTAEYFEEVIRPQVTDLVERYGSDMMWADGNPGPLSVGSRTAELIAHMRRFNPELVVNDRWGSLGDGDQLGADLVRTFEYSMPPDIVEGPWELRRGLGTGFGYNRTEREEHHLSGHDIISLLTEVIAKGGNLLLGVGPNLHGSISDLQSNPLRDAGQWIKENQSLVSGSRPWTQWGDEHVRYFTVEGVLHAVDLTGRGHFSALNKARCRVDDMRQLGNRDTSGRDTDSVLIFQQDDDGLHIDRPRYDGDRFNGRKSVLDVAVYRIETSEPERPIELFSPTQRESIPLEPLLRDLSPGEILQLGDGTYLGPISVPPGVIVRGLGTGRTVITGGESTAVQLHRNARLEHVSVSGATLFAGTGPATVEVIGNSATVLGCDISGQLLVNGDDVLVRATSAGGIVAGGSDRLTISRCQLIGKQWDIGIHLMGGGDHEIDSCELVDHMCAIRIVDTTGTVIRGNNISARWWGIHLRQTERSHVHGNQIDHTMRAIDVDGGTQALVDGNAVADGDSGCVVEWGASGCQVSGNCWERCRIGLLVWDATGLHEQDNLAIDLHETDHAIVYGP